MTITRVGSVALVNSTLADIATTQQKLADMQMQISSGYQSSDFAGLNGSVERFSLLQAQQRRTDQFQQENAATVSQLQTADNALGNIVNISTSLTALMVQTRSAVGQDLNFEQQARDLLASIGTELNATNAGKYVFGGTDTISPPVPDANVPTVVLGVPDAGYYQGSQQDVMLRIDENSQFAFPARADNISFQKVFAAVNQAITAFNSHDDAGMQAAISLIQDGHQGLVALRAKVQSAELNVNDTNTRLNSLSLYLKGVVEQVSKTDVVAVTTQIADYQSVLQATFQIYARLSSLRLSDYLK